jgi:hypothetical protein
MECCTCGAMAKNLAPGDFDGIVVECAHCGTYEVGSTVLNSLLRLSLAERAEALEKAKRLAPTRQRPAIDGRCFDMHGTGPGSAI